jgi:lysophospholipase L1-like esterase
MNQGKIAVRKPLIALCFLTLASLLPITRERASGQQTSLDNQPWIATWGTGAQAAIPGHVQTFNNQTLRLIVHTSVSGERVRIRLSNTFGDGPLLIGAAHVAIRAGGAKIVKGSDHEVTFSGQNSTTVPKGSMVISDPIDLDVPALSDLAISLFLPRPTRATTSHLRALQTNYLSRETGDTTAKIKFSAAETFASWPFLTGVDVMASPQGATIVALGSSLTDGQGSTPDANRRWPDVLAERLQKAGGETAKLSVVNEGIIGNRLLNDSQSPRQAGSPTPLAGVFAGFGPALGEAGLKRFERDVIAQPGIKYVIVALGVNDILFPGSFIPESERITAQDLIDGYDQIIARAHQQKIRVIITTIPPFEHSFWSTPLFDRFYSSENEKTRQDVNKWIRTAAGFDGVIDFDAAVRDPDRPTQILPTYDAGDHLHVNDAGNVSQGNAISLELFRH